MSPTKTRFQKICSVITQICFVCALISLLGLAYFYQDHDKVMTSSFGATSFFFFTVGIVMRSMAVANLPSFTVKK